MDNQVNKMVIRNMKLVEMIIKGKGEYTERAGWIEVPPGLNIRQFIDQCIIDNVQIIVKME